MTNPQTPVGRPDPSSPVPASPPGRVIVIDGMSSFVACHRCGAYHNQICPRCGR